MKRPFVQIINKFDDSKFEPLPIKRPIDAPENIKVMCDNLWSMFSKFDEDYIKTLTEQEKLSIKGGKVNDYAWTKNVKELFYEHPFHKRLYEKLVRKKQYGWLSLQYEPADYNPN